MCVVCECVPCGMGVYVCEVHVVCVCVCRMLAQVPLLFCPVPKKRAGSICLPGEGWLRGDSHRLALEC